jgi:hypothetical protein
MKINISMKYIINILNFIKSDLDNNYINLDYTENIKIIINQINNILNDNSTNLNSINLENIENKTKYFLNKIDYFNRYDKNFIDYINKTTNLDVDFLVIVKNNFKQYENYIIANIQYNIKNINKNDRYFFFKIKKYLYDNFDIYIQNCFDLFLSNIYLEIFYNKNNSKYDFIDSSTIFYNLDYTENINN